MRYLPALSVSLILLVAGLASARNGGARGAEPRSVVVTVNSPRLDRVADGTTKETMLQAPIISTLDNMRGKVEV